MKLDLEIEILILVIYPLRSNQIVISSSFP